jgi:hypothetical protein
VPYGFTKLEPIFSRHVLAIVLPSAFFHQQSAKTSGGYDDGEGRGGCALLQKSFLSPAVREYLEGEEWQSHVRFDALLHQAVNASLDLTIDALGRDTFQQQLERYRTMQRQIHEDCAHRVRMPCDAHGHRRLPNETDCLFSDTGCGYDCIDESLRRRRSLTG